MGLFDFLKKKDAPKEEIEQIEKAEVEFAKTIENIIKSSIPKEEPKKEEKTIDDIKHNKAMFDELTKKLDETLKAKDERINELTTKLGELLQKEEARNEYLEKEAKTKLESDAKAFALKLVEEKKLEKDNAERIKFFEDKYIKDKEDALKTAELLKPIIDDKQPTPNGQQQQQTTQNYIKSGLGSDLSPNEIQAAMNELKAAGTWKQ